MVEGTVVHKCLRCGREDRSVVVPDIHTAVSCLIFDCGDLPLSWGMGDLRKGVCLCDDGGLGVMVVVGAEATKNPAIGGGDDGG